jgi:o-succinylbenzoate synthase
MKIAHISFTPYRLTFREPLPTAQGMWQHREGFVICCEDTEGKTSYGEAAPLPSFGTEDLAQCAAILELHCARLQGEILPDLENWLAAFTNMNYRQKLADLLAPLADYPAARHGLETALLGLHPLQQPQSQDLLKINGLIGAVQPEYATEKTIKLLNSGYTCLKIKFSSRNDLEFASDLARFQAVIAGIKIYFTQTYFTQIISHKKILLRLDVNQSWQLEQALVYMQKLQNHLSCELYELDRLFSDNQPLIAIEYIEQPVANLMDLKTLTQQNILPVAADESCRNLTQIREIIIQKAANILVLKPMVLGGILTTFTAVNESRNHGIASVLTSSLDGAIAEFYNTNLGIYLAKQGYIDRHCGLGTGNLFVENLCYR